MLQLYTKDNCPQCTATKRKLDEYGIEYEMLDAVEYAEFLAREYDYRAAPVVINGKDSWVGFRPDLIGALKK